MSRPAHREESWYAAVAELMAKEGIPFRRAAEECGQSLTPQECTIHQRRKEWLRCIWNARHAYHAAVGNDPERTKDALLGAMTVCYTKLMDEGSYDKAASIMLQVAKVEGWLGPDTEIKVLGTLSQKELDELKARMEKPLAKPSPETKPPN